jgi:TolB-like protein/DNA-binding winged helix-turn-helix (wHTH) protein
MAQTRNMPERRQLYTFNEFTLDLARGALIQAGEEIYLRPQCFAVLSYFVQHPGVLVSKGELLAAVWHNAVVGDDSITQCIVEVRRVIGDDAREMIRTVPKRGFIFEPTVVEQAAPKDRTRNRALLFFAAALAMVALLYWSHELHTDQDDQPAKAKSGLPNSVAVLAFNDMSESQDQQYFGDGLAEEILNRLTVFPELNVLARTASFSLRKDDIGNASIAEQLGVKYFLEGSVRKSGNTMRISAQLINAKSNAHVWADSYEREITAGNIFDVQSEVANSVAAAIGAQTRPMQATQTGLSYTDNAEALDQYLKGMYFQRQIETNGGDDYEKALQYFDLAIAADPDWAPPYAASGRTLHFWAGRQAFAENAADFERSRALLLKAIELDPEYAPAYESLAYVTHVADMNFTESERLYQKALALGDRTRWGYAILLRSIGRFDAAVEQYQLALLNDPLSRGLQVQLAKTLLCAGRNADSLVRFRELAESMPEWKPAYIFMADLYLQLGDRSQAEENLNRASPTDEMRALAGPVFAQLGMTAEAEATLQEIESSGEWLPEYFVRTAVLLGQRDRALDYLLAAASAEPRSMLFAQCNAEELSLTEDPRYQRALHLVGIPPQ